MTDSTGAVYDLGYEPYEGERRGRSGARRTIVADGIRRVLGLRRKARRKVLPWGLIVVAVIPAIVAVGLTFFIPGASDNISIASEYGSFYMIGGTMVMLFSSLAAPELLIPDRKDGVLSMLSSRPLTSNDYVFSRFASVVIVVGAFLLLPQLVLYIGESGTDTAGLFAGFVNAANKIPKSIAVGAVYTIALVPLAFLVAGMTKRKAIASSVYIASMLALSIIGEGLVREADFSGNGWFALISPVDTAHSVNLWIFGSADPDSLLTAADIHPMIGLGSLVVVATASVYVIMRRYRRLL